MGPDLFFLKKQVKNKSGPIIVIGAGHAGIEASLACARMGCKTLLLTLNKDTIGLMSCNPAIGGVGKGQLVKEIDALGGEMAKATDACGIQFRILNASKGPAVHSSRAQVDKEAYKKYMRELLSRQENLTIKEAEVKKLIIKDGQVKGVFTDKDEEILSRAVIICPGTFLNGLVHIGLKHFSAGRINEPAAIDLADNLKDLGFSLLRFKTGTCPRLDKNSIDFSALIIQKGDHPPIPFSFSTERITREQLPCYITYTNKETHKIIFANLDKSPLYTGVIKATGVRYCPSVEDKVVKFADKERHQVFLEPEGYDAKEVYPNGLSTSLPEEVQLEIIHSIDGLREAKIIRFGYGIEHTVVCPTQLYPSLETKLIRNLYLAGQINGTTGYEEAAAQGLIAGINAALKVKNKEPLILDRSSSYIGVLIDDLTTKGTPEPYRMFTSRVEYRLILREDNADVRLRKVGYYLGLISSKDYRKTIEKDEAVRKGINFLRKSGLEKILRRPEVTLANLKNTVAGINAEIPDFAFQAVETEVKYAGFIRRQIQEVAKFKHLEKIRLPEDFDYSNLSGLSREIKEKLKKHQPVNLGQASRISGITPVAISALMIYLKKLQHGQK